jgi:hypothetical protein
VVAGFAAVLLGWSKLMLAEEFAADRTAVRALAGLSHDAVAVAAAALRQPWMQSADLGPGSGVAHPPQPTGPPARHPGCGSAVTSMASRRSSISATPRTAATSG